MSEKLIEICRGHLTPFIDRCEKCNNKDGNNKYCENYQPLKVREYYVEIQGDKK